MSMSSASSSSTLVIIGKRSASPSWTVRIAPAVKYVFPPAHSSGHLSIKTTRSAPASRAAIAAEKPALPPPTTRTSHSSGMLAIVLLPSLEERR